MPSLRHLHLTLVPEGIEFGRMGHGTVVYDDFLGVMPFEKLITLLSTLSIVYPVPASSF